MHYGHIVLELEVGVPFLMPIYLLMCGCHIWRVVILPLDKVDFQSLQVNFQGC